MERYLGLDVHRDSCSFCVLSEAGKLVQRQMVETNGQALVSFVRHLRGQLHLCLEEGKWSQWLYEVLSPHVKEIVVVWPERRLPAKSDALDSRELAERLRTGGAGGLQGPTTLPPVAGAVLLARRRGHLGCQPG